MITGNLLDSMQKERFEKYGFYGILNIIKRRTQTYALSRPKNRE